SAYGAESLRDATILKLARALWILPLTLILPAVLHRHSEFGNRQRVAIPWFIALFVLAAVARSVVSPKVLPWFDQVSAWARVALVLTLFLVGSNLTREQLRAVGVRPLVHGVLLWAVVASATLGAVIWFV